MGFYEHLIFLNEPIQSPFIKKIEDSSDHQWGDNRNDHQPIIPPWYAGWFYQIRDGAEHQDDKDQPRKNEGQIDSHILIPEPYTCVDHRLKQHDDDQIDTGCSPVGTFHVDRELFAPTIY